MQRRTIAMALIAGWLILAGAGIARAGTVQILAAEFRSSGANQWSVDVTLRHDDAGWDHYADRWRVVDGSGKVLGERVLYHPHENEQPFTRGLRDLRVPEDLTTVSIEAHDSVHGWAPERLAVDLTSAAGGRLRVETP